MLRVLQFKSNEHSIIRTRSCQHGQYGPHRAARSKEVLLRTCSKYATLHFVLQNSVWKCHNASGRELPRQASSNDVQILSLLVADISDSMLHPVSFRSSLSTQASSLHPTHLLSGYSQEQRLDLRGQDACLSLISLDPFRTPGTNRRCKKYFYIRSKKWNGGYRMVVSTIEDSLLISSTSELWVLCHPHKSYVQHWTVFQVVSQREGCLLNVALLQGHTLVNVRSTREDIRAFLLQYIS